MVVVYMVLKEFLLFCVIVANKVRADSIAIGTVTLTSCVIRVSQTKQLDNINELSWSARSPWSFGIVIAFRQFRIRNRSATFGANIDGNSGVRVMGHVRLPSLRIHSSIACRSNVSPDLVMMGSTNICKVRGQMNS